MAHYREFKMSADGEDYSLFGALPGALPGTLPGTLPEGCEADFILEADIEIASARLVIHDDGWNSGASTWKSYELTKNEEGKYSVRISTSYIIEENVSEEAYLFYYHYAVTDTRGNTVYLGGEAPTELCELVDFVGERQLLIYRGDFVTSRAFASGVTYHIFVDRFARSGKCAVKNGAVLNEDWRDGIPQYGEYPGAEVANNVFFGGDLYGIIEKLPYISSLGVTTIYLSPVFEAYSNHKYDIGDYLTVDEMFGGDEALAELCSTAKKYGISIILDGVFNHTGSDSVYFNKEGNYSSLGAYQSKESPYYDWYTFRDYPDEYECWWGVKVLPRVNSGSDDFRSFICGNVIRKWMQLGVAGWRLDVADELDNRLLDDLRREVRENNSDGVIIGEVWEDASDKVSYGIRRHYLNGCQLDSVMNYPLRSAVIDYVKFGNTENFRRYTEGLYRRYPKCVSDNLMNFLGTHDTERILTVFGGEETGDKTNAELSVLRMNGEQRKIAVERLKFASAVIAGLPGSICIFYGDEAGTEGYRDPFCRMPFPWHNIDTELYEHYRRIGNIRKKYEVFRDGLFVLEELTENYVLYSRLPYKGHGKAVLVAAVRKGSLTVNIGNAVSLLGYSSRVGEGKYTIGEMRTECFMFEGDKTEYSIG